MISIIVQLHEKRMKVDGVPICVVPSNCTGRLFLSCSILKPSSCIVVYTMGIRMLPYNRLYLLQPQHCNRISIPSSK